LEGGCYGAGEESFAGSGGSIEEDSFGRFDTYTDEELGIQERELDYLM
jgi:hypothetical protein